MKRRTFIENSLLASAGVTLLPDSLTNKPTATTLPAYLQEYKAQWQQNPRSANQEWFKEAGLGISVHYGLYSLIGKGKDVQFSERIPVAEYKKLANRFTASQFDADALTDLARLAGARYIDFTCRYHDGFSLFQTSQSTFNSLKSAAKRDFVRELYEACEKKGIALFLSYAYAADWVHPFFPDRESSSDLARPDYSMVQPEYLYEGPEDIKEYTDFIHRQFVELLTQYPHIAGIRFHPLAGYFPKSELFPIAKSYSYIRSLSSHALVAFEEGANGEEDYRTGNLQNKPHPVSEKIAYQLRFKTKESEFNLQPSGKGYYLADNGKHIPPEGIVGAIQEAQKKGYNLLLNLSLLPDGSVHPEDRTALNQVGKILGNFDSNWHLLPDRTFIGENYWPNRLQDWHIVKGGLECNVRGRNRSVALLNYELGPQRSSFYIKTDFRFLSKENPGDYIGFRLGTNGPIDDYRSAAIYGKGLDVGVRTDGKWVIGSKVIESSLPVELLAKTLTFDVIGQPSDQGKYTLQLRVKEGNTVVAETEGNIVNDQQLSGGLALIAHSAINEQQEFTPSARFEHWHMDGPKLATNAARTYGPIYFAQYTLHNETVKLSALCAPVSKAGEEVVLELKENNQWKHVAKTTIDPTSFMAAFRLSNWNTKSAVPYRLTYTLFDINNQAMPYEYEGSIAPAPAPDQPVKLGLFSCNCDHGFPDTDLRQHILHHDIDAALFLGDQFYESSGGFGVEATTLKRSILDYMRKWQQFGWSYRDIFRHVPCISIPDDHDVYHGNVWGEGGKAALAEGSAYIRQDSGGYKMHPEWVKMVQETQCSHLPDPYDPTPIKQDISVYYTHWNWGPISFAIIEDRKFKSAPKNIFPAEAGIQNGFITNLDFKDESYLNAPQAELLGPRQEKFLEEWAANWGNGAKMKILLSATNFCTLATLPENSTGDSAVPTLPIPPLGEYVSGDAPTRDMDSNGWPHSKRNKAVDIIRRGFTLHLAGDQHLPSVVRYGVNEHNDAGFAFAGPALNNIFPRRWWPTLPATHQPLPDHPVYTGNFEDGFKNKITVHAVASPRLTGLKPAIIHDRVTGYGIVKINPKDRLITFECWKRSADPATPTADSQYEGWPITIQQTDNYGRTPYGYLPEIEVVDYPNAVVQVINEKTNVIEYTLRIKGNQFRPPVFEKGKYTVRIGEPDQDVWKEYRNIRSNRNGKVLRVQTGLS